LLKGAVLNNVLPDKEFGNVPNVVELLFQYSSGGRLLAICGPEHN
jgi:hypothetical protein